MRNIRCRFCDKRIWYDDDTLADDAFVLLNVHVRAQHLAVWREIQACLADVDGKLATLLNVTGDVMVDDVDSASV